MASYFRSTVSRFRGGDNGAARNNDNNFDSGDSSGPDEITDGGLTYIHEKGGNNSLPSYQEATGAPVERHSPLGYSVGPVTIIFLNVSMMIGTGVFSTPSSILGGTGSVGLSMIFWVIGFLMSLTSLAVYLEFAAYFPNRSGAETVYLEQAYLRPRFLFPVAFAFQTVVLSFSSSNSIVLAQYLFRANGHTPTNWQLKGVALAGYSVAFLLVAFHTKTSYYLSNAIGTVKVITLTFIAITGLVVLGGHTRVADPHANFIKPFEGTATAYGLTNALYKIIFSYGGYANAFNVVNEIKSPVKQLRRNAFIALLIVTILYIFANIAYFAAVPKAALVSSSQVAASLFFQAVFGDSHAVRGLNVLIALSSFGNLVAVLLGQSRVVRECGRQGVLPFPRFWSSTRPFGTPLGPYSVAYGLTIIMILAPPAGDAFNFVVDTKVYPSSIFNLLMGAGLYIVRWRRARAKLPQPEFKAWHVAVIFNILVNLYAVVMPWYPPKGGIYGGDVSFLYSAYILTGIGIVVACGLYYWAWIYWVPVFRGYRIRQRIDILDDGAQTNILVKVPVDELATWDAEHDKAGHRISDVPRNGNKGVTTGFGKEEVGVVTERAVSDSV
ncbi:hypothetical protein SPBR_02451 [Sporothrix brasiliensis 5110]|uniref:High affinity methionine permease n=1 Tax=Sporothrix brasiliensis 5110 TaxID=1398154 RepID=A0A0C2F318_9PEZI|nr:uncharacterized protein SPBR_02451 [Sporothrix brasiliensis 5110]KIH93274.1 hypothetical protein SPBR_02451 [Sporothrix brasiliensis 5110]